MMVSWQPCLNPHSVMETQEAQVKNPYAAMEAHEVIFGQSLSLSLNDLTGLLL